ncbi:MAG: M23 family metallopeptidase [Pseudomonadota bacterium]
MKEAFAAHIHRVLDRIFPDKRLFIRSDDGTRFVRLRPSTQAFGLVSAAALIGWTIVSTSILLMDSLGAGSLRDQARRDKELYESRISDLAAERDARAREAVQAQERFAAALAEVSQMQSQLLRTEDRRRELETGIDVIQTTLRKTMSERDSARTQLVELIESAQSEGVRRNDKATAKEMAETVALLNSVLTDMAREKAALSTGTAEAEAYAETLALDLDLMRDRNDRIFRQLEEAVATSLEPLGDMFESVRLPTDRIIEEMRRSYSGQGGPLTPISLSTKGADEHPDTLRMNDLLARFDELNLHRLAIESVPLAPPVYAATRFTSGFGMRRDPMGRGMRMHNGSDFAGAYGTPIHATATGTVVHAGWQSGYGRVVKIEHAQGFETVYAHLARIRVNVGEKVSRGDRIGDMGNSGRSTGTHLHYEVRIDGKPVNPMTYIKAARDVF